MQINHLLLDCQDAWAGLCQRPARSILSGLGIAIGVVALVAMLSIGEGAKRESIEKIETLGSDTIRIENALQEMKTGFSSSMNLSQGLSDKDANNIASRFSATGESGFFVRQDNLGFTSGAQRAHGTLLGVSSGWMSAERLQLASGRGLSQADVQTHARVCVAGNKLAHQLRIKVGAKVHSMNTPCTLIGILATRGRLLTEGTGLSALDFDQSLVMPHTSLPVQRWVGAQRGIDGILVKLDDGSEDHMISLAERIDRYLRKAHRGVEDYHLFVPAVLMRKAREEQLLYELILGSIAALSLVVGGIGVMNIMLSNISEHTREIGLRMAVGASPSRIISLYLWHSILLCLIGGLVGLAAGIMVSLAVQYFAGWQVAFSPFGIIMGPLSATLSGIIFGLHPAIRASALDPAIALREY